MSPSSSALPVRDRPRSRQSSNATPIAGRAPSKRSSKENISSRQHSPSSPVREVVKARPPQYTVFIRLPFIRQGFEDPPPVQWDAAKDRKLWKIISAGKSSDLDWEGLSQDFAVDLQFLLMQAAWLSERHMERMKKQVARIAQGDGASSSGTGSAVGGLKMERGGSRNSRILPGSGLRRESPIGEPSGSPGTSTPQARGTISRSPSTTTVTQSKVTGSTTATARQQPYLQRAHRGSSGSGRKPQRLVTDSSRDDYDEDALEHEGRSESDSDDEPVSAVARSQAFRRPLMARKPKSKLGTLASDGDADGDDDDDDSGGCYLPFAAASKADPAATIRSSPKRTAATLAFATTTATSSKPKPTRENSTATTATDSSPSSSGMQRKLSTDTEGASDTPSGQHVPRQRSDRRPGPLSPRHRAQLASMSPGSKRDGIEGTPSMGSSFSDLDDASVTQSALEDALMSNMRHQGGSTMASRMSSLRDALGRRNG
ncbi:Autophagy-related protein 29 [Fulvia fulva]|nr:Autophagy-related protein 29 [Fulvia fulva]KAK4609974.1 Autophagy-related protein 29 [Fulvia fulva]WPV37564.1 Autophagy-related protein 29 [Fulvia fulva]